MFADTVAAAAPGHDVDVDPTGPSSATIGFAGHRFGYQWSATTQSLLDLRDPDGEPHTWSGHLHGPALISALWWARRNATYSLATSELHEHLHTQAVPQTWRPTIAHRDPTIGATALHVPALDMSVVRIEWRTARAYLYCVPGETSVAHTQDHARKTVLLKLCDAHDHDHAHQIIDDTFTVAARAVDRETTQWP